MSDIRTLRRFYLLINETRELESPPANELETLLLTFVKDIRKENGGEYEPSTLPAPPFRTETTIQHFLRQIICPLPSSSGSKT